MIANEGRGSSIVYDSILSKFCCCCDCCNCCKKHLGTDFLFGLWFFMVFNVIFLTYGVLYVVAISATSYVGWTIVRKAQHGPIMIHMAPHVEQRSVRVVA